jgi:hypothetical protein
MRKLMISDKVLPFLVFVACIAIHSGECNGQESFKKDQVDAGVKNPMVRLPIAGMRMP